MDATITRAAAHALGLVRYDLRLTPWATLWRARSIATRPDTNAPTTRAQAGGSRPAIVAPASAAIVTAAMMSVRVFGFMVFFSSWGSLGRSPPWGSPCVEMVFPFHSSRQVAWLLESDGARVCR